MSVHDRLMSSRIKAKQTSVKGPEPESARAVLRNRAHLRIFGDRLDCITTGFQIDAIDCALGSFPDNTGALLISRKNVVCAEWPTRTLSASVKLKWQRISGEASDSSVGCAHPNATFAVLEERQHPVGR